jgi:hypothetical protein
MIDSRTVQDNFYILQKDFVVEQLFSMLEAHENPFTAKSR